MQLIWSSYADRAEVYLLSLQGARYMHTPLRELMNLQTYYGDSRYSLMGGWMLLCKPTPLKLWLNTTLDDVSQVKIERVRNYKASD